MKANNLSLWQQNWSWLSPKLQAGALVPSLHWACCPMPLPAPYPSSFLS